MPKSSDNYRFAKINVWVQECIVLAACFLYLFFQVHPKLILELQPPVFLTDINFFNEFLKIPGGLTDWLAALLMQYWLSDLSSTVLLVICFWLIAFLTRKWMETLTGNHLIHTSHLIPVVLLVILHSQYDYHLSINLALIINLSFLNLIIRMYPKLQALQIASYLTASFILFWVTGGAFLIFAVLYVFGELILQKNQFLKALIILAVSITLPYISSGSIFLVTLKDAYSHNLISENPIKYWYLEYFVGAFYLLALIYAAFVKFAANRRQFYKISESLRSKIPSFNLQCIIGTFILLCGIIMLIQKTYDSNARLVLEVNQSVRESRWQEVLNTSMQCSTVNPLLSCQTNLALFQSDMLLERMFAFPQFYGSVGLFMNYEWCSNWPEKASNIYWKLGLVNESLHWAHEALETKGSTPEILKRLGMVYLVKGKNDAAESFFLNLKNVFFHENTADDLIKLNKDPLKLAQDSETSYIRSCMPIEDFVSLGESIPEKMKMLLKRNPKNKMAFEYLMAFLLMKGDLQGLIDNFSRGGAFSYSHIPKHIQEALLVMASVNPNIDQNQLKNLVQPVTFQRFENYQKILHAHQDNISIARQELQRQYGDTYWYYLMYVRPGARQSENHNEFQ